MEQEKQYIPSQEELGQWKRDAEQGMPKLNTHWQFVILMGMVWKKISRNTSIG